MEAHDYKGVYIHNVGTINLYNNNGTGQGSTTLQTGQREGKEEKKELCEKKWAEKHFALVRESIKNIENSMKEFRGVMNKRWGYVNQQIEMAKEKRDIDLFNETQAKSPFHDIQSDVVQLKKTVTTLQKKSETEKFRVLSYSNVDLMGYIKEWTGKNTFKVVFDTERDEFSVREVSGRTRLIKNVLFLVETASGCVFGSYVTTKIPPVRAEAYNTFFGKDEGYFVFTMKNPHNILPTKFDKKDNTKTMMFWKEPNELEAVLSAILCFRISADGKGMIMNQFKDFYNEPTGFGDDVFTGTHEPNVFDVARILIVKCE
ncbi:hypothetical protein EIN_411060 [Entamoeba invadens IP1]|uniref:TLDc domain-containing protein n=1 Tax=Entamoeba invadens IP1 TaxID=370355 RepID=A0A0A1U146_ENTIV|nr:hypothetical protein EIN_411060 [Entamoeba invadens IP1]ELP87753.1 hypothetical protein EIN_411060 [Entamoeba invadens IP1]|eukprot:XP_004254524.1 hypothetical protein EIN_411060 [Entamoeba invadens IP1]